MLPADELDAIRALVTDTFPNTCDIYSSAASATKGSWVDVGSLVEADVPCRLMLTTEASDDLGAMGNRIAGESRWVITMPYNYNASLGFGYRLVVDGVSYKVVGLKADHDYRTAVRAFTELVT